jgi:putative transposase
MIGEYYHIYNRGAHKDLIFHDKDDLEYFLSLLYIANNGKSIRSRNLNKYNLYNHERELLVEIVCYCLMPNHYHICAKEIAEKGVYKFVHKLCTAYVMYYNLKYKHSGTIFQGNYKFKHVDSDEYLRYLIDYIHLNPFNLDDPELAKSAKLEYFDEALKVSSQYEYSSLKDYLGQVRLQTPVVGRSDLGT